MTESAVCPYLNDIQAAQFALMILAGVTAEVGASYFLTDPPAEVIKEAARKWPKQKEVTRELVRLQGGKDWLAMSPAERVQTALDKHYNEMAFYLYHNNYADLDGGKKSKADICRESLEARIASAGKVNDPVAALYQAMLDGKLPLPAHSTPKSSHGLPTN